MYVLVGNTQLNFDRQFIPSRNRQLVDSEFDADGKVLKRHKHVDENDPGDSKTHPEAT